MKRLLLCLVSLCAVALGAKAQIVMRGDVTYSIYGSRLHLEMDGISDLGDTDSNQLRFRIWASKDHWQTYDRGKLIAFGRLPRVRTNQSVPNIHTTVHVHYPDTGWYHIAITLEERIVDSTGTHWKTRDAIVFDGEEYLSNTWTPWPF